MSESELIRQCMKFIMFQEVGARILFLSVVAAVVALLVLKLIHKTNPYLLWPTDGGNKFVAAGLAFVVVFFWYGYFEQTRLAKRIKNSPTQMDRLEELYEHAKVIRRLAREIRAEDMGYVVSPDAPAPPKFSTEDKTYFLVMILGIGFLFGTLSRKIYAATTAYLERRRNRRWNAEHRLGDD